MKSISPIFLFLIFLSSCSAIDSSRIAPGYSEAFKGLEECNSWLFKDALITNELVRKIYLTPLLQ